MGRGKAGLGSIFYDMAPRYLGLLVAVDDLFGRRALRSASTSRLVTPPIKLSTVGSRAFPVAAAQSLERSARGRRSRYRGALS